jgi:YHS domain-containing protein
MFKKKSMELIVFAAFGLALLVAVGCASAHEGHEHTGVTGKAVKTDTLSGTEICPVSNEKIDPKTTKVAYKAQYKGKSYYLCCTDCLAKFKKNPAKYVSELKDQE